MVPRSRGGSSSVLPRDMMDQIGKGKTNQVANAVHPMPSPTADVSLGIAAFHLTTPAAARKVFEHNSKMLAKGISSHVNAQGIDQDVTFRIKNTPVDGAGDEATWDEHLRQLSVLSGTHIFYLIARVADTPADDLAIAKKLANEVAPKL